MRAVTVTAAPIQNTPQTCMHLNLPGVLVGALTQALNEHQTPSIKHQPESHQCDKKALKEAMYSLSLRYKTLRDAIQPRNCPGWLATSRISPQVWLDQGIDPDTFRRTPAKIAS
jgi:hypothetical protein